MEESQKDAGNPSVKKTDMPSNDVSEQDHDPSHREQPDDTNADSASEENQKEHTEPESAVGATEQVDASTDASAEPAAEATVAPSADTSSSEPLNRANPETTQTSAAVSKAPSRWRWLITASVIAVLVLAVALVGSWLNQRETALAKSAEALVAVQQTQQQELAEANRRIEAFQASLASMEASLIQRMGGSNKQAASLANRVDNAEKRIAAQNKRLLSMSTTSREDWLLAEAEYLLRLANQRVLVERSADSAIGLLREADAILYGLDDPDLKPLRSAISDDLVALGLVETIDVEGIYIELNSLAKSVESLPLITDDFGSAEASEQKPDSAVNHVESKDELSSDDGMLATVSNSVSRFFSSLKDYVRVIDHADKPVAILPPDATAYLHMNLRLIIERAQLALLREQQSIYQNSLNEAELWVERYFHTDKAAFYVERFAELKQKQVVKQLPDITGSLELLKSYIEALHKINSVATPQGNSGSLSTPISRGEQQ